MSAFQLKVLLIDSRPPLWRRVIVNPDITFWGLHSIFQDLFGWEDEHLHSFRPFYKGAKEKRIYFEVHPDEASSSNLDFITPGAIIGVYYDETKEKLSDWLDKKRNSYLYTYDFGANWQHEVILEKIIATSDIKFAQYVGGKRRNLEEDSRPDGLLDCTLFIKAAEINDELWQEVLDYYGKT